MKCTHSTYDKLLTYKTPCHLFVDPKKFWMTFRQVESKYVHILKSYSSEVLFSLTCSDLYTCSDESHPLGFVVEPFFFLYIYLCILPRRASTQTQQWVVWCLLGQSMWTLQKQTGLLSALTGISEHCGGLESDSKPPTGQR